MIKQIFILVFALFALFSNAQVGINTKSPDALLHIVEQNPADPSRLTGVILPRIEKFPQINPSLNQNGMLFFLDHSASFNNEKDSIYFWDANLGKWDCLIDTYSIDVDYDKIIVNGEKLYNTSGIEDVLTGGTGSFRFIRFNTIDAPDTSNKLTSNGELYIGKKGQYSLSLTGCLRKITAGVDTYDCEVLVNGVSHTVPIKTSIVCAVTANKSGIFATTQFVNLNVGDVLTLKVTQMNSSNVPGDTDKAEVASVFSLILNLLKQ